MGNFFSHNFLLSSNMYSRYFRKINPFGWISDMVTLKSISKFFNQKILRVHWFLPENWSGSARANPLLQSFLFCCAEIFARWNMQEKEMSAAQPLPFLKWNRLANPLLQSFLFCCTEIFARWNMQEKEMPASQSLPFLGMFHIIPYLRGKCFVMRKDKENFKVLLFAVVFLFAWKCFCKAFIFWLLYFFLFFVSSFDHTVD